MTVQSVMTANPACCTAQTSLREVAQLMAEHDCGQIPVVDELNSRRPIGVVTDRDIAVRAVAAGFDLNRTLASECMSSPCITVSEDSSVQQCCEVMEQHKIRRVPVVDAGGAICGIVALADVARSASSSTTAAVIREVSTAG